MPPNRPEPPTDGANAATAAVGDPAADGHVERLRALVLAPSGRDAALVGQVLRGAALDVISLPDPAALCTSVVDDGVGVVVLTEEALAMAGLGSVPDALASAPDWSDLPFILFVDAGWGTGDYLGVMDLLGRNRNLTVLERPIRPVAFRSVVEMAVGGRRQQLRVRDLLARVRGFNDELQARVDAQTAALMERAAEVEALAKALTAAERRERERIAQVLHDDLQQVLYGLKIHVELMAQDGADTERARRVEGYVDEAISQTRHLVTDLHPPMLADDGVAAALGWVVDTARERHGLTVHLDVIEGIDIPAPDTLALLTRAARELLFNVVKHAGTDEAWVRAWCDAEGCHLEVRDEGEGFAERDESAATGLGLAEIEHRVELAGGAVEVDSAPGEGTAVELVLPVDEP